VNRPGARSAVAALLTLQACDSFVEPHACVAPEILSAEVTPVSTNVLAAVATIDVRFADSVAIRHIRNGVETRGPAVAGDKAERVSIVLLGLHSSSTYEAELHAYNRCGASTTRAITFSTGALPQDLPAYRASGSDASVRYIAFAAGSYGLVIDNTGRVIWYHRFPGGPGLNFQAQKNGRYVARPAPASGEAPAWVEIDVLGNVTRTLACQNGKRARFHDLLVNEDGSYWALCDETRAVDLSARGLSKVTPVTGTAIQHVSASGAVTFDWSPFDHMDVDISVLDPADKSGGSINWTHGNSLDLDVDGNILVSFRNLDEILKVDSRTGQIIWRMGGSRNQFSFENTTGSPFRRQHSVRSVANGELHLLDNLGQDGASRLERYEYDEVRRVARLVMSHSSSEGVIAQTGGTVQRVPGNRTLVSFGSGGNVEEVDESQEVVWRIDGNPGYVFRAQRIYSLYKPGGMGEAR
jgi:outer membrane protein assembly factor BamB